MEGFRSIGGKARHAARSAAGDLEEWPVSATRSGFATRKYADAVMRPPNFDLGASTRTMLKKTRNWEDRRMLSLQPAEWAKPRGFSHGVAVDGPGRWVVLAGQTGGDERGDYQPDMAVQVGVALRRIVKLLAEAGAGPEHIVRLTWYLTSRSEYEAAGAGIGAAWRDTLGRNFPPSTLLYIEGLVDIRAKVEIEVTAFVPAA
jgi:enamine deaminase RidA (YjgF/YER057c/UK114 family)